MSGRFLFKFHQADAYIQRDLHLSHLHKGIEESEGLHSRAQQLQIGTGGI